MASAINFAKFLMKRGLDTNSNTYDGNMKLQKLLFFADFISLVERGLPLFDEPIRAFTNGCVVEEVRLRYKNDYAGLLADSKEYVPSFEQDEYTVLNLTQELFGGLSARELSDLNHSFAFWKTALDRSIEGNGYKDKTLSIVNPSDMLAEKDRLLSVIGRFRANKSERAFSELINGVVFYHSPDFDMNDDVIAELEKFSMFAEDTSYSIYMEEGSLVIY